MKKIDLQRDVGCHKIEVPSLQLLCINKSNVDLITKSNYSHYEMIAQVEKKFREWSPATVYGIGVTFDDEILRREFFKSLRKPYP